MNTHIPDAHVLAEALTAWLSPGVLARAVKEYSDSGTGRETTTLRFKSLVLSSGTDGGLEWFVRQYLEHAHIPPELLVLTRGHYASCFGGDAFEHFSRPQLFTGTFAFATGDANSLLTVTAPVYQLRIVRPCLDVLLHLVATYFDYYTRALALHDPSEMHLSAHGEWPLPNWIALHVARSCGHETAGRIALAPPPPLTHSLSNLRGVVTVNGPLATSEDELFALQLYAATRYRRVSRDDGLHRRIRPDA